MALAEATVNLETEADLRIVIADDSAESLALLRAMLAMIDGVDVVAAADDGREAVESVERLHPDAVMLDIAMPRMDGLEAAELIHSHHPETTIMIYSAYDAAKMGPAALAAGADAYLPKTADVHELLDGIQRALPDRVFVEKASLGPSSAISPLHSKSSDNSFWKERYRILLDALTEGVLITSSDGEIVHANFEATQILQVPISNLVGRFLVEVGIVGDVETSAAIDQAMRTGRPASNLEYDLHRTNGTARRLIINVRALRNPKDLSVREVLVSFTDISKQRSSEREAAAIGRRLRSTFESMLDGFAILSPIRGADGGIVDFLYDYINLAGCRINGLPRADHLGHRFLDVHPRMRDSELFGDYVRAAVSQQPVLKRTVPSAEASVGQDDMLRRWDVCVTPSGTAISVAFRDVTQQAELDARLEQREEEVRSAIGTIAEGFFLTRARRDEGGHIVDLEFVVANEEACRVTNRAEEEFLHRGYLEIWPSMRSRFEQYRRVVETGEPFQTIIESETAQGLTGTFGLSISRIGDGCAIVVRDLHRKPEAASPRRPRLAPPKSEQPST